MRPDSTGFWEFMQTIDTGMSAWNLLFEYENVLDAHVHRALRLALLDLEIREAPRAAHYRLFRAGLQAPCDDHNHDLTYWRYRAIFDELVDHLSGAPDHFETADRCVNWLHSKHPELFRKFLIQALKMRGDEHAP